MPAKKYIKKLLSTILIFTSFIGGSIAQPEKAAADIQQLMKELKVVGLSVAVVQHNQLIYTHSFGLKDKETNTALTDQDVFRIASISKTFSATAILQLVEAKKISLDDDISQLIGFSVRNPKYPNKVITLKMVLSHRSSINDSRGYFSLDSINPASTHEWAKCYNDYEPGTGYQYCNFNFNMVGTVIEKISGERFDQYVKHHILDPMNLYGGYCVDSLDSHLFTTLYEYDSVTATFHAAPAAYASRSAEIAHYVMGYSTPIFSPTGGMKISATDLSKYMIMHMNYGTYHGIRIFSKKSAKIMQHKLSEEEGYGLAMMTMEELIPGKTMKGHTGSAYGLYSAMFFQPKEKFGIVVITNGCGVNYESGMNSVTKKAIGILYDDLIK